MRLRRSDPSGPGFTRLRSGRGFRYLDQHGNRLDPADIDRIRALVIPPAWREVWICPWPNGHIQATGLDDAGRRQYRYHDQWRRDRDEQKFDRCLELAPLLPDFRRTVEADLTGRGFCRERVLAIALRMLDHGVFRVGGDEYVTQHGTHGAATLLRQHVRVRKDTVVFEFPAKGNIDREFALPDPLLVKAVTSMRRARCDTDRLLVCRERGAWREVHAEDVNQRFKELVGEAYSVKDLRTWNATVLAAAELAATPVPGSARARHRVEAAMFRSVAQHLGNTPAVAKKSYVDPRLLDRYADGTDLLAGLGDVDLADPELRAKVERAVINVLTD